MALLAGCSGGRHERNEPSQQAKDEAAQVLAAAPAKTRAAKTGRVSLTLYAGSRPLLRATGITRLDRESARYRFAFDTQVGAAKPGTKVEVVLDGDDIYSKLVGTKRWVHVPRDDSTFNTGVAESLDYLSAVTGDANPDGNDTVRGTPVRVYKTTVDLKRVADHLPPDQQARYRERVASTGLPQHLPLEVAIDEGGRITRMDYQATVRATRVEFHFELYDFGVRANLAPPKKYAESGAKTP